MRVRSEARRARDIPPVAPASEMTVARADRLVELAGVRDEHLVLLVNGGEALAGAFLGAHPRRSRNRVGADEREHRRTRGVGLYAVEEGERERAAVWRLLDADLPGMYEGRVRNEPPERYPFVIQGGFDRALVHAGALSPEAAARRVLCCHFLLGPGGLLVALVSREALVGDLALWAERNAEDVVLVDGSAGPRVLVVGR